MKFLSAAFEPIDLSRAIPKLFLVSLLPAIAISCLVHGISYLFDFHSNIDGNIDEDNLAIEMIGVVFLVPIIETLLMALCIAGLRLFTINSSVISVLVGIAFGFLHSYAGGWAWFFGPAWSFWVFSRAYMAWRPTSFKHAFLAGATPHAAQNALLVLAIYALPT